mgnify:CR=1 FL=1
MLNILRKGFTLIELLIVVAIIAILAAIAVPNFLEAQTRAKVSRVKSDLRTLNVGLESYFVDNNKYPTDRAPRTQFGPTGANENIGNELSTPIAYISSVELAIDAFKTQTTVPITQRRQFSYRNNLGLKTTFGTAGNAAAVLIYGKIITFREGNWRLVSAGPDKFQFNSEISGVGASDFFSFDTWSYDPTNGTISRGDIFRTQKYGDGVMQQPEFNLIP